jgi:N-acyl-L-homoserine lactone synthetase
MQIVAVRSGQSRAGDRLIDQSLQLRAKVFEGRLGWEVTTRNGREFDQYDGLNTTYILATDEASTKIIGCSRLLSGDGPTMLGNTFPQLLGGRPMPRGSHIVESSRFCVDTSIQSEHGARGLHQATMVLFAGILDWSIQIGCSEVITVTDLRLERLFGRVGLPFERFGPPQAICNTIAVAGTIPATTGVLNRVKPGCYQPITLLEPLSDAELLWGVAA